MKNALNILRTFEPARLAGIKTALFGLLASVGLAVSPALDAKTGALVAGGTALLTLIQSVLTRSKVYSPGSVDQLIAHAQSGQDGIGIAPVEDPPDFGPDADEAEVPEGAGG